MSNSDFLSTNYINSSSSAISCAPSLPTIPEEIWSDMNGGGLYTNEGSTQKLWMLVCNVHMMLERAVYECNQHIYALEAFLQARDNQASWDQAPPPWVLGHGQQTGKKMRSPTLPFRPTLYKTQMCTNLQNHGHCKFGDECWFAHNINELRSVPSNLPHTPHAPTMTMMGLGGSDFMAAFH